MSPTGLHNFIFLIFIFITSTNIVLIASSYENKCQFTELEDLLQYYAKGINPLTHEDSYYKWEFIHCVNGFHNKTYLLRDEKNPEFNDNAGIFIGSSINLFQLEKDIDSLINITDEERDTLKNLSKYKGNEAIEYYKKIENETLLPPEAVERINKEVYEKYYNEMKSYFELRGYDSNNNSIHGFSFDLNLLTFFVKYKGIGNYLKEVKNFIVGHNDKINYNLLSYYFLNLKSDNYVQKKLWSRIVLSSDHNYYKNKKYIGIYYDSSLAVDNEESFKNFLIYFLIQFRVSESGDYYYFSLANVYGFLNDEPRSQSEIKEDISKYNYTSNFSEPENITEGISKFVDVFNTGIKDIDNYYQKHLIIFVNNVSNIKDYRINTDNFTNNGIQVILFAKINKEGDEGDEGIIREKFHDKFNIIFFYKYDQLEYYPYILKSAIIFNVQNFDYENEIELKNIKTNTFSDDPETLTRKNIYYNLKITFDENLLAENNEETYYYFHIQITYDDPELINISYHNNINMTFYVSQDNPYPDIINYSIPNYCLSSSVSKDKSDNPYINYSLKKYNTSNRFYISIMANDLGYSLQINLVHTSSYINDSNGRFGKENAEIRQLIYTFPSCPVLRQCSVDYIDLLKYYSSGVHRADNENFFHEIIDLNMMACLYNNVLGPYFEVSNNKIMEDYGPYIGYAIDLSKEENVDLYKDGVPLYLVNKLHPFLINSIKKDFAIETMNDYNLNLTLEESDILNIYHMNEIMKDWNDKINKMSDTLKLSMFLRILENPINDNIDKDIDDLNSDRDKYLQELIKTPLSFVTTKETINFQLMLIQSESVLKPKKCLVSIVIAKALLWSNAFLNLLNNLENYRISLTVYDLDTQQANTLLDFEEDIDKINGVIQDIKEYDSFQRAEVVNIDTVLSQQKNLFQYYDKGVKKCIVIVSTFNAVIYRNSFSKPNKDLLQDLYNDGILIFDYSDHINFIEEDDITLGFYNSSRNPYIQHVPFLDYVDMAKDYQTLTKMINRFPIPVTNIMNINLDLDLGEEIHYEFNFVQEIEKLKDKDYFDTYNILHFNFDTTGLKVYFSQDYIFPNNYSSDISFNIDDNNKEIKYDLKKLNNNRFFMSISSSNKVDNSIINIEICDDDGNCLRRAFNLKFYISFIVIGVGLLGYGIYICFCETNFKKESNIFERK